MEKRARRFEFKWPLLFAGLLGLAGCSSEATLSPVIHDLSPTAGPHGTEISITGENLGQRGEPGSLLFLGEGSNEIALRSEWALEFPFVFISEWTSSQITLRVPYPVEGSIRIQTDWGEAFAGEFSPSWIGEPPAQGAVAAVIAILAPSPDRVVALLNSWEGDCRLVDWSGGAVTEHALACPEPLTRGNLVEMPGGDVQGVAFGSTGKLYAIAPVKGALTLRDTDVRGHDAAGGLDQAGLFAWVATDGSLARVRPGEDGWVIDGEPLAMPGEILAMDMAPDGTLYAGYAADETYMLDRREGPRVARIAPGSALPEEAEVAGPTVDDSITSMSLTAGGGGGALLKVCWYNPDLQGSPASGCDSFVREASGAWEELPRIEDAAWVNYGFSGGELVAAYLTDNGEAKLASNPGESPGELVFFPAEDARVFVDSEGAVRPLVVTGETVFPLRRR